MPRKRKATPATEEREGSAVASTEGTPEPRRSQRKKKTPTPAPEETELPVSPRRAKRAKKQKKEEEEESQETEEATESIGDEEKEASAPPEGGTEEESAPMEEESFEVPQEKSKEPTPSSNRSERGSAVELENRELQVEPPAEKEEPKEESAVEREQPAEEEEARDANEAAEEGERAFEDWIAAGDEEEQAGGQAEASTIPVDEKEVANLDLPQVTEESVSEEAQRAQDTEPEPEPEPEPEEPEEEEEGPHAPYSTPVDREAPETARESPARTATPPKAAEPGTGILEKGHIYFLYRPKVRVEEAESFDDVQRMFIILKPSDGGKCRLIIVGRKRLPDIGAKNRFWAFVDAVAGSVGEITRKFEAGEAGSSGNAKTSQPVRPAGMGAYVIVEHNKHSHLAYSLQLPQEPGEVQEAFNIGEQGSFVLSIKNPEKPAPPGVGLGGSQKAEFPQDFQERFGGRRFIDANPPTLLDFEGAELLLIGASAEVAAESQEAAEMLQGILEEDEQEIQQLEDEKVFRDLEMDREQHPAEPLSGIWA